MKDNDANHALGVGMKEEAQSLADKAIEDNRPPSPDYVQGVADGMVYASEEIAKWIVAMPFRSALIRATFAKVAKRIESGEWTGKGAKS